MAGKFLLNRFVLLLTPLVLLSSLLSGFANAAALPIPAPPSLAAVSYLLIDYRTGTVIAEKNSSERVEPASLTKMMTAYLVSNEIRHRGLKPSELVPVSSRAHKAIGSRSFLEPGSSVSVRDLMYGLIVQSGNDASIALAEHVGGSEEGFVSMMNATAANLGMKNTNFANSTGLPHPDHYTTARDLAVLARAVIGHHPKHYELYSVNEFTHNDITQKNRNKLLLRDKTVDGIKTGHTEAAGYCLVASAERDGMRLISVLLGARNEQARSTESLRALNYGFRFYESVQLSESNKTLGTVRVWGGLLDEVMMGVDEERYVTLQVGQKETIERRYVMSKDIVAPVIEGQQLGELKISLEGKPLVDLPLVALQAVDQGSIFTRIGDSVRRLVR